MGGGCLKADWEAIARDYLTGNLSYQGIAEKYGLPCSMVSKRGREENWPEKRKQIRSGSSQGPPARNRKERVRDVADQLLGMIEMAVRDADQQMLSNLERRRESQAEKSETDSAATRRRREALLDMGEIKQLTAALKEILLLLNEDGEEERDTIAVLLEGDVERYAT